jgi:hypothetical protein
MERESEVSKGCVGWEEHAEMKVEREWRGEMMERGVVLLLQADCVLLIAC